MCAGVQQHGPVRGEVGGAGQVGAPGDGCHTIPTVSTVCRSPGQLQRPTGVCVLRDGRVAVADYDNKWVAVKISTLNMSEYCEARGTLLKIGTV